MIPIINFIVSGQELRVNQPVIVSDTIDYLETRADFRGGIWDGLLKFAHFSKVGGTEEEVYDVALVNDLIRREEHLNLTTGIWRVWLHGMRMEDGEEVLRVTTTICELHVQKTGALEGEVFPTVTPSVGEQFVAAAVAAKEAAETAAESAEDSKEAAQAAAAAAVGSAAVAAQAAEDAQAAAAEAEELRQAVEEVGTELAEAAQGSAELAGTRAQTALMAATQATQDAQSAAEAAERAEAAAAHQPVVDEDTLHWLVWSAEDEDYVDTGVVANGHSPYIDNSGYWRYWSDDLQTWVATSIPARGADGQTPFVDADADLIETGGAPSVHVTSSQAGPNVDFNFTFYNLKGSAYVLTSADKQEIAQIVLGELPVMEGGTY